MPLDYSSAASPRIQLGFRWLPATGHPAGTDPGRRGRPRVRLHRLGTRVPGDDRPAAATRNLLLVDLRGTGTSTPVNCPGLEQAGASSTARHFNQLVAACGAQLNHTWHYRGGGWVHASDLFNTAYSARDVAGVLHALRLGRVDLYGDSYGSWFAQVFASRYPGLLRSVTLDSTYQVLGLDPWYATTVRDRAARVRAGLRAVRGLRRGDPRAAQAWARIAALARRLARLPGQRPRPPRRTAPAAG